MIALFFSRCFVSLCRFKNTQDLGVIVFVQTSADFCFASGRVRAGERKTKRERSQTDRKSKVIHLKL